MGSADAYINMNYDEPYTDPAHYEEEDDWDDEQTDAAFACDYDASEYEEPAVDEWAEYSAYVANEWEKKWFVDDPVEQTEMECVACLVDVLGPDCFDDPIACAEFIQNGASAFFDGSKFSVMLYFWIFGGNVLREDFDKSKRLPNSFMAT